MSKVEPWLPKPDPGPPRVSAGRFSIRRSVAVAVAVGLLAASPLAWSYVRALTVPGGGTLGVRTVDWVRQIGFSQQVAGLENLWYSHHAPPVGGAPSTPLSARALAPEAVAPTAVASPSQVLTGAPAPAPVTPIAYPPLPGEGQWQAIGGLVSGAPAMYAAYLRPDPIHTSLTAGLVWIDPNLTSLHLVAGSVEPGGTGWPDMAPLSPSLGQRLLATFNAGFRFGGSNEGFYEAGHSAAALVPGAASLVISQDGKATVGQWGRDVTMSATVAAVRQNLSLIVDGGQITPGVYQDSLRTWGATVRNQVLVWRSGIGVTASGALVYAAGPGLSIMSLATLLMRAGAVRAMELDINSAWVAFVSFSVPPGTTAVAADGTMLLPGMKNGTGRYLGPSTRDFFALVAR